MALPRRLRGDAQPSGEDRQGAGVVEGVGEIPRTEERREGQLDIRACVAARRVPPAADVEIAIAERLELANNERVLEQRVERRHVLAGWAHGLGERIERRHLERRGHRHDRPDVVRVALGQDHEALLLQPAREVIVDAVLQLQSPIRAVAIEDKPVDVALVGTGRRRGRLGAGGRSAARRGGQEEGDDDHQGDRHEDGGDPQEDGVESRDVPVVEPHRRHDCQHDQGDPGRLLDDARDVQPPGQIGGMAIHQQPDDDRCGHHGAAPAVAEDEAGDEGQDGRPDEDLGQGDQDRDRCRLAQVLRPEEEHGVRGEDERMQAREAPGQRGASGLDSSQRGLLPRLGCGSHVQRAIIVSARGPWRTVWVDLRPRGLDSR